MKTHLTPYVKKVLEQEYRRLVAERDMLNAKIAEFAEFLAEQAALESNSTGRDESSSDPVEVKA